MVRKTGQALSPRESIETRLKACIRTHGEFTRGAGVMWRARTDGQEESLEPNASRTKRWWLAMVGTKELWPVTELICPTQHRRLPSRRQQHCHGCPACLLWKSHLLQGPQPHKHLNVTDVLIKWCFSQPGPASKQLRFTFKLKFPNVFLAVNGVLTSDKIPCAQDVLVPKI